jgi:hypothetical protein
MKVALGHHRGDTQWRGFGRRCRDAVPGIPMESTNGRRRRVTGAQWGLRKDGASGCQAGLTSVGVGLA